MLNESLRAERITLPDQSIYEYAISINENYLALHDIVLTDGEFVTELGDTKADEDLRGKLTYIPAGMATHGWGAPATRSNSFTAIYFGIDAIPEALEGSPVWVKERFAFADVRLEAILAKLDHALRNDSPFMRLLAETLCDLAIVEIAYGDQTMARSARKNPALRRGDIDRVQEFIIAHLADDISLSDLAHVVGLSKFHFCRAYKAATGVSPYQEILATKINRSRDALEGGMTVQAAASLTGFRNQSQFSRTFKHITGQTPSSVMRGPHARR
jgi:AraC family transcriptional regulator